MSKMIQVPLWQRWWLRSMIAVVVAVAVPIVSDRLGMTTSLKEQVYVGVGTWMVGMIIQIAYSLHLFQCERLEDRHVLEVIDAGDCLLLELQSRFREIAARTLSGRPNRVFIDYCHRSLKNSLNVARRAAQRGELEVRDHHFDTIDTVLAAFAGCQDRTFRCVWLIESGDRLFDKYWREYMKSIVELSRQRRRTRRVQVRILFVLEDQAQFERASVKTVLSFVATERNFKYRLMSQMDYQSRLGDSNLDNGYLDFGIYGDHLLFRTTSYEPNIGVFSDDQTVIATYRRMHDTAMNAAETLTMPDELPVNVSLERFLDCDSVDEAPETTPG